MELDLKVLEQDVPPFSATAMHAMQAIDRPGVTHQELDSIIRHDPGLTQRVLRMANSPFYKGGVASQTVKAAVVRLGHRQLKNLIIAAAAGEVFDERNATVAAVWDHLIATALISLKIARMRDPHVAEEAFVAGLLHDIGKLVALHLFPRQYQPLLKKAQENRQRVHLLEAEAFGHAAHAVIGGLALRKWGLGPANVEAASCHHQAESNAPDDSAHLLVVDIVSLASIVANNLGFGIPAFPWRATCELECAKRLAFKVDQLDGFKPLIADDFEALRAVFV